MAIGSNVNLKDKLIKKTTPKTTDLGHKSNVSKTNIASIVSKNSRNATKDTLKATFYIKKDILQKLYNFAYWERYSVTDAFNITLADGLKGKNTKDRGK